MSKTRRGAPTREQQIKNRIIRLEDKLQDAILKGNEKVVANYLRYLDVLDRAARGELKDASVTNQLSSAKIMLERCEKVLESKEKVATKETEVAEEEQQEYAPLISLVANED